MKNLKIFISLTIILLSCTILRAGDYKFKPASTFHFFSESSFLKYKIQNVETKAGWAFGGGLGLQFLGVKNDGTFGFGLGFGVEFASYRAKTSVFAPIIGQQDQNAADEAIFLEFEKKQKLWMIQIPIMPLFEWTFKGTNKKAHSVCFAIGTKLGFTQALKGNYEYSGNGMQNPINEKELLNFEARSYPMDKNSQKLFTFTTMVSLEIGYKLNLFQYKQDYYTMGFYIGPYVDWIVLPWCTSFPKPDILAYQPDYDKTTLQQVPNDTPYAGKLNMLAVGLKIKLSLDFRDLKK